MKVLFGIIIYFLPSFSGICQNIPTGTEVILRFINEIGGKKKLMKVRTIILEVEGTYHDIKFHRKSYTIAPDRIKIIQKTHFLENIDIMNDGKYQHTENGEIKEMDEETRLWLEDEVKTFPQLYYLEDGSKLKNMGEKDYEKGYYEVEVTLIDGRRKIQYYSIETGLLWKTIDAKTKSSFYYWEYDTFKGVKMPTRGKQNTIYGELEFYITRHEINSKIDPEVFVIKPMPNNGEHP
jgi:hypothetical protein